MRNKFTRIQWETTWWLVKALCKVFYADPDPDFIFIGDASLSQTEKYYGFFNIETIAEETRMLQLKSNFNSLRPV